MEKGKQRHIFPGNNTPVGFYSYYQYILPQSEANHIFCLKGGPGVGKSTFMKIIGTRMQNKGFLVEYLHCSSDPNSLDGIVIPHIKIAFIDGTSPHVVDPKNPGVVDEIINLGDYWDRYRIKKNREQVMKINAEVGRLFKRAYRYIAASKCLMDDVSVILEQATDEYGAVCESQKIIDELLKGHDCEKFGKVRKQFASAITPDGIVHYIDTLFDEEYRVYKIGNKHGIGVSSFLKRIAGEALIRGLDVDEFYCPMEPENKVEHIIIRELKMAFISRNIYFDVECDDFTAIDLAQYTDEKNLDKNREFLEFGNRNSQMLLFEGMSVLNKAKKMHDDMEEYYIPYMNFEKEREKMEDIIDIMLIYADEFSQ